MLSGVFVCTKYRKLCILLEGFSPRSVSLLGFVHDRGCIWKTTRVMIIDVDKAFGANCLRDEFLLYGLLACTVISD